VWDAEGKKKSPTCQHFRVVRGVPSEADDSQVPRAGDWPGSGWVLHNVMDLMFGGRVAMRASIPRFAPTFRSAPKTSGWHSTRPIQIVLIGFKLTMEAPQSLVIHSSQAERPGAFNVPDG